jgi:transposase
VKTCDNIVALARELGVHRRLLYEWRDRLEGTGRYGGPVAGEAPESALRKQIRQLQRVLAEKTLEVDFFKGALQKVEARRRESSNRGEKAYTTKSKP